MYSTSHSTKEELLDLMTIISQKMKIYNRSQTVSKTRISRVGRADAKRDLIFEIFLKLIKLYKVADRMVEIEGSQANLRCLLASAKILSDWFEQVFSKIPSNQIEEHFETVFMSHNMTQMDINILFSPRMISNHQKNGFEHHIEVKKSCQEQKAFRESFLKTQTDFDIDFDADAEGEETKLLSIEEAILIIQKLERKYQAISRRNYVRFVRERAAELHGVKTEIDATQAAVRIQARTRGYFARKLVREMRDKELEILNMKPESIIKAKCIQRERMMNKIVEKVEQTDTYPIDLEIAIEELKTHFFLAVERTVDEIQPQKTKSHRDGVYLDACFRGIVAQMPTITFDQLISQSENVKIDGRSMKFDLRSFITLVFCIPLGLNSWKSPTKRKWMLLLGGPDSGKTAWTRAISKACSITHVHISKNVVKMGKRKIYTVVKKLAKQERRLLISIDKIDILRKNEKSKGSSHRQLLLRSFLQDISETTATVIGISRIEDLDISAREFFPIQINISNPKKATRYELAVDGLSRNFEQDRLPKVPRRIFDIEGQTSGFSYGKASKFVTNRWSAASNNNKTNSS